MQTREGEQPAKKRKKISWEGRDRPGEDDAPHKKYEKEKRGPAAGESLFVKVCEL
jgi:hypothetical protein